MKIFRYGFYEYCKKVSLNTFIALQLAVAYIALNLIVGFYNNISMRYTPYEKILNQQGFYINYDLMEQHPELMEADEIPAGTEKKYINEILSTLKGDYTLHKQFTCYNISGITVDICEDDIFNKFTMPLSEGKWKSDCAVVSYNSGYKIGDKVPFENGEITVSGILTPVSYSPALNSYQLGMTSDCFYEKYDAAVTSDSSEEVVIISLSTAQKYADTDELSYNGFMFVTYDNVSDEDYQHDKEIMTENFTFAELESINESSIAGLNSQYIKFLPVLVIIIITVIIGIISYSIVSVLKSKRDTKIFYQCGATSMQCFGLTLVKGGIIFVSSIILSAVAYFVLDCFQLSSSLGIRLMMNNVYLSVALTIGTFAIYSFTSYLIFNKMKKKTK